MSINNSMPCAQFQHSWGPSILPMPNGMPVPNRVPVKSRGIEGISQCGSARNNAGVRYNSAGVLAWHIPAT